jgi:RNA polymerase sigma-70 factor (ECF subfamily)
LPSILNRLRSFGYILNGADEGNTMMSYAISKKKAWPKVMTPSESDLELVRRIASGDEDALRELYSTYGQRMYAFAIHLAGDAVLAEDAVQEALIAVWHSARRLRGEGRVLTWLLGIIRNQVLKSIRRQALPLSAEMEATLTATDAMPEELIQVRERSRWLNNGLAGLSKDHRAALDLVFYQGLSLAEAAEVSGCPTGTIKSRLSYARQYLRACLKRKNEEEWR